MPPTFHAAQAGKLSHRSGRATRSIGPRSALMKAREPLDASANVGLHGGGRVHSAKPDLERDLHACARLPTKVKTYPGMPPPY